MRARNIKPGFFHNDELAECDFATRLLFAGLWCMADREGRLEDRPKKIKMHVFPADDVNIEAALEELSRRGLIVRYEAHGIRCIEVVNFLKHQNPHRNESPSGLPPKPFSRNGQTDSRNGQTKDSTTPADSGFLNSDSLIPDPPSLDPDGDDEPGPAAQEEKPVDVQPSPQRTFPDTPEGVAQEFCFHQSPRKDDEFKVALEIKAKLVAQVVSIPVLRASIRDPCRDRSEFWWKFVARVEKDFKPRNDESPRARMKRRIREESQVKA